MYDNQSIREGMTVRDADGHKLGKVFAIGEKQFQIEKGLFFPKDYLVDYRDIADIRGHEIYLRHGREALRGAEGAGHAEKGYGDHFFTPDADALSSPTASQEGSGGGMRAEAPRGQEAGGLHTAVATGEQVLDVPVRTEHVRVERVAPMQRPPSAGALREEAASAPVHAEEVESNEQPVVRREVRVRRGPDMQERRVAVDTEEDTPRPRLGLPGDDPLTRR